MNETEAREILLLELHRIIARVAHDTVAKVGAPPAQRIQRAASGSALDPNLLAALGAAVGQTSSLVSYPPGDGKEPVVSHEGSAAITALELSQSAREALTKLVADACASTLFDLFCLMDGVGAPELTEVPQWLGASLTKPAADTQMLHDRFFDSYWDYRKRTTDRS